MVDSGTNAVIVPLHPDLWLETAERKAPSSLVRGPIPQTLSLQGQSRLGCGTSFLNHTLNFGRFSGGRLEMLREGAWVSKARTMFWLSFDALKVVHRVTPVTERVRYSVILCTPGKLERLTAEDWDCLGTLGFPIYLCNPEPFQMRRLEPGDLPRTAAQSSEVMEKASEQLLQDASSKTQVSLTTSSKELQGGTDPIFSYLALLMKRSHNVLPHVLHPRHL